MKLHRAGSAAILKRTHGQIVGSALNPLASQEETFKTTWKKLEGTAIYKERDLQKVRSYRDYLELPADRYESISSYVERIKSGEQSVLFHDNLKWLILTSGTSGFQSKVIPYNKEMINVFSRFMRNLASTVYAMSGVDPVWDKRLTYGNATPPISEHGFPAGYISGVMADETPWYIKRNTFPSPQCLSIDDWEQRLDRMWLECRDQDIRMVSAVPLYLVSIFEGMLARSGKSHIKEIWPNIKTVVYSGTSIDQYKDRIEALLGYPVQTAGAYIASEAPIGFSLGQSERMWLNSSDLLLSFAHEDAPHEPHIGLHEVEDGKRYSVHVGTPNGFYKYAMGDLLEARRSAEGVYFQVIGRNESCMNLCTEKVPEKDLRKATTSVASKLGLKIPHFFVHPGQSIEDQRPCYTFTLLTESPDQVADLDIGQAIDEALMDVSDDYKEARVLDHILAPVQVHTKDARVVDQIFAANRHRGQFKPKVILPDGIAVEQLVSTGTYSTPMPQGRQA